MSIWRCVASNTPFSTRFLSPYLCWRKLKSEAYVKCFHRSFLYDTEGVILQDSLNTKSSARNRNRDQQYRFLPEVAGAIMEHWASGIFSWVVGEWTRKVNTGRAEDWPQTQTADWRYHSRFSGRRRRTQTGNQHRTPTPSIYQEEVLGRSDSPLLWSDNLERQVSLIKSSIKEYLMREFRLGAP